MLVATSKCQEKKLLSRDIRADKICEVQKNYKVPPENYLNNDLSNNACQLFKNDNKEEIISF